MGLTLERLLFDPSNVNDGPLVGSYIISTGGNTIDDTSNALNVYFTNTTLAVTANDLDIRDLSASQDNVAISDGTDTLAIAADGSIAVTVNGTVTVDATDLDIRAISHTTDSIQVGDGTEIMLVNADGSINVNLTDDGVADNAADSGNPFKIGGRAYSTGSALAAADSGDRVDMLTDVYRRQFVNDAPNVACASSAVSVQDSATLLPASALAGRTRMMIQNNGDKPIFVGPSGVTTSTGLEISKGSTLSVEWGEAVAMYAISTVAGQDVRVLEVA